MTRKEQIAILNEVLDEISRVNAEASHTVFNPAAKEALVSIRQFLKQK